MRMIRLTLDDGTTKELTCEEAMASDFLEAFDGRRIIKTEFFEESGT